MPSGSSPSPTVPQAGSPQSEPTGHTPGEWIISCREQDDEIHDEHRFYIRLQPYPSGHVGKLIGTVNKHLEGGEANARLMAAAPTLLAAAEAASRTLFIATQVMTSNHQAAAFKTLKTLEAAIALAKAGGVA